MSGSPRAVEAAEKLARLRERKGRRGARAAVLGRAANFAWLSGGGRSFIAVTAETGAAWLVVDEHAVTVVANNIEAARLREEELAGLDWEVRSCDWWEPGGLARLARELTGDPAGVLADGTVPGAIDGSADLAELRTTLGQAERTRAAAVGRDTAEALEAACRNCRPGETEFALVGRLAAECYARGIEPVVHLAAADGRAALRRHPLPTEAPVRQYALVAACGMRGGLVVSCTRLVHFGPPSDDLRRRWQACAAVDAAMISATRPGATAGQIFDVAVRSYAAAGFAGEWRFHHQGGLAGYASREWRAEPGGLPVVGPGQIFAWNPSVAGTKSEDTILVGAGAPRILTETGAWPLAAFEPEPGVIVRRPQILVL